MLFKLAQKYQVQIFATTHSREMIEAFKQVGLREDFEGSAGYFEMIRHIRTGEIDANKISMEVLEYTESN